MIQAEGDVEHELIISNSSRCMVGYMMEVWSNPLVNMGSQKASSEPPNVCQRDLI